MGTITFIEHNQQKHDVTIDEGKTLMEHALDESIPGIDADCGGECACGTCHVIIDEQWADKLETVDHQELQLLEMTPDKQPSSRLSCQVKVSESHDGMTIHLPEFQM